MRAGYKKTQLSLFCASWIVVRKASSIVLP
jgi:hypothetical protein